LNHITVPSSSVDADEHELASGGIGHGQAGRRVVDRPGRRDPFANAVKDWKAIPPFDIDIRSFRQSR
jgi:hypothetical protein